MKILLYEGDKAFGRAFQVLLTAQGHRVMWCREVEPADHGSLNRINGRDRKVTSQMSGIKLALLQGPEVAESLKKQGVKILGISANQQLNEDLLSTGAIAAANKAVVFVALFHGKLNIDAIVTGSVNVQEFLRDFAVEVKANAQLRREAEQFLRQYLPC